MSVYDNARRALPDPLRAKGRSPLQPGACRSADFADSLKPASLPGRAASQSRSTRRPPVHDPPCLRRTGVAKQLRRHSGTVADVWQVHQYRQGQDARCMSHDMHLNLVR